MEISIKDIPLLQGFTLQSDSNAIFNFNTKGMYIEGKIHIIRNDGLRDNVFMRIVSPKFNGYSIKGIKIGPYSTFMSINNNTFSLSGYFNDKNTFSKFIPFV